MKLDEAIKTLRENGYVLNETTAVSAPDLVLARFLQDAWEQYKTAVKEEIENADNEEDREAGKRWLAALEKNEAKAWEGDNENFFAELIFNKMGLSNYNPYRG